MRCGPATRLVTLATLLTSCCTLACGQSCVPAWDTTVGNPGVSGGYIGELRAFDDGAGEMLYAGGSFPSVGGQPGTSLIARWDRVSQTWSSVGGGLDTGSSNGFVTAIAPFDAGSGPELVVGGVFQGAYGVPGTEKIARWNGSAWSSLNAGFSGGSVWSLTSWDDGGGDRLYVGGRFPTAGGVTANGIAAWDGVQWHSLGTGITGSFNPYVAVMMPFDDGSGEKLYVGGRFDTVNGLGTPLIARWDGTTWQQVGSGLINDSVNFGLESMAVYDDGSGPALYVGGRHFHAPGQPVGNVARWDGQQWTTVGAQQSGRVATLSTFDDGNGLGLYLGGNALPNLQYFARLVGGQWQPVGGGVSNSPAPPWPSTFALYPWHDALYVGGNYNRAGGLFPCGGIAAWGCPGSIAVAASYGAGCGNPPLALAPVANARPVLNTTAQVELSNIPSSLPFLAVGWSDTTWGAFALPYSLAGYGMPGCDLLQSAEFVGLPTAASGPGTAAFSLPIPNWNSLLGREFYLQGWAYAPGANATDTIVSNGVEWVLGNS